MWSILLKQQQWNVETPCLKIWENSPHFMLLHNLGPSIWHKFILLLGCLGKIEWNQYLVQIRAALTGSSSPCSDLHNYPLTMSFLLQNVTNVEMLQPRGHMQKSKTDTTLQSHRRWQKKKMQKVLLFCIAELLILWELDTFTSPFVDFFLDVTCESVGTQSKFSH